MDIWGEGHPDVAKKVPLNATQMPTSVHSPTGSCSPYGPPQTAVQKM